MYEWVAVLLLVRWGRMPHRMLFSDVGVGTMLEQQLEVPCVPPLGSQDQRCVSYLQVTSEQSRLDEARRCVVGGEWRVALRQLAWTMGACHWTGGGPEQCRALWVVINELLRRYWVPIRL
jgi:hypothetical protein